MLKNTLLSLSGTELLRSQPDITISKITTDNKEQIFVVGDATNEQKGCIIQHRGNELFMNDTRYPILQPYESSTFRVMAWLNQYKQYSGLAVALIFGAILYAFDGFKGM